MGMGCREACTAGLSCRAPRISPFPSLSRLLPALPASVKSTMAGVLTRMQHLSVRIFRGSHVVLHWLTVFVDRSSNATPGTSVPYTGFRRSI